MWAIRLLKVLGITIGSVLILYGIGLIGHYFDPFRLKDSIADTFFFGILYTLGFGFVSLIICCIIYATGIPTYIMTGKFPKSGNESYNDYP